MNQESVGKVLLYSGGMDSYALRYLWKPDILLAVDLGTQYGSIERKKMKADSEVVFVEGISLVQWERADKIIPLRNLILCAIAAQYGDVLALGATAGDRVRDKDYIFADLASATISYLWQSDHWTQGKRIKIELPFKHKTKTQIVSTWIEAGMDPRQLWDNSFSCYHPNADEIPCGTCKPCFRKWIAFKNNGFDFEPSSEAYIKKEIIPLIMKGVYNRKNEESEILEAIGLKHLRKEVANVHID